MLESQVVESVFARMLARYGNTWFTKWDAVPIEALKADWGRQLQGLSRDELLWGLGNLPPDLVPNAAQFRQLCRELPEKPAPQLAAPAKTEEEKARSKQIREAALAAVRDVGFVATRAKARAQAEDFERRIAAGERLSFAQRDWLASAKPLLSDLTMPGDFKPIPPELLPAAMRADAHVFEPDAAPAQPE
jgi:hypothetical protein